MKVTKSMRYDKMNRFWGFRGLREILFENDAAKCSSSLSLFTLTDCLTLTISELFHLYSEAGLGLYI